MSYLVLLQASPKPVCDLRLAQLRKVVDTLLAEGVDAPEVDDVLRWRFATSLHYDGRVSFEDDSVVYELVDQKRNQVVVLDYCSLVDRLPTEKVNNEDSTQLSRVMTTNLNRRCKLSRSARSTLYNSTSFSSTLPTT